MDHDSGGMRRRGFFTAVGAGVVGVTVGSKAAPAVEEPAGNPAPVTISLTINGRRHRMQVEARSTLLQVIRERLGLTGTKLSCGRGECGACTVLIDGAARYACLTLAVEAEGHEITTIEGIMSGERLDPVQHAFVDEDAMQCGYCTPGQVMAAKSLLQRNPNPGPAEIREAMSGNLCRCGSYDHILKAVRRAAAGSKAAGGAQ